MRSAHASQQLGAADVRQHQVKDQHVVGVGVDEALTLAAVDCEVYGKALCA